MGRLLFIGAHPDDETFFAAGCFAKYSAAGAQIAVVCATSGQCGRTAGLCSAEDLGRIREQELRNAMQIVGVHDIAVLPYHDKELAAAPIEEMRSHLVHSIRRARPDVVITFDPQGGNHHPDHIAISRFATDALTIAGDARWLPELGPPHHVRRVLWNPPTFIYKLPVERELCREPGFDFLIDVGAWAEQKAAAFRAHCTQFPGLKKLFFDDPNGQRTFASEAFRFAWGDRPVTTPARDLFEE